MLSTVKVPVEERELIIASFIAVFFNDMVVSGVGLTLCSFYFSFSPFPILFVIIGESLIPPEFVVFLVVGILD